MVVSYSAPEFVLRNAAITDIARYYNLPTFSFAGSTDSKLLDIQAGAETGIFSLVSALSGANLLHDVGYLESGLTGSLEMIAIGNEIAGMVRKIKAGISVAPEELAVEAISEIGPGGNFIAHEHTYENFKTALWFPKLFKRHNYDGWANAGKPTAIELANSWIKEILESHKPEKVSDDVQLRIDEIIDRARRVK
jgi:trimethylamine--corrinoid protein Co-methyltransferase